MRKEILAKAHILNSMYMTKSRKIVDHMTNLIPFFSPFQLDTEVVSPWDNDVIMLQHFLFKNIYKENKKIIQSLLLQG